jgi:hypothetical protein
LHNLKNKREKLRKDLLNAGIDLNKTVDFWGQRMTLDRAISFMGKDDIEDGYKMIWEEKHPQKVDGKNR